MRATVIWRRSDASRVRPRPGAAASEPSTSIASPQSRAIAFDPRRSPTSAPAARHETGAAVPGVRIGRAVCDRRPRSPPPPAASVLHHALPEHYRLHQRIARQPVRAVHAGAGALRRMRTGPATRRPAHTVRPDAAHQVVRRRRDRDRVRADVDPDAQGRRRKSPGTARRGQRISGPVQSRQTWSVPVVAHLRDDGARDHVTRREVGQGVIARHERLARRVAQHRTFAPHRLRNQERRRARPARSAVGWNW